MPTHKGRIFENEGKKILTLSQGKEKIVHNIKIMTPCPKCNQEITALVI